MKTKKWAIIFLLFTGMILFAVQSALGGCEVSNLDWLISGENAPGPKLEGPLTIFYQCDESNQANDCVNRPYDFSGNMYFFLRLRKGSKLYSFAGGPYPVDVTDDLMCTDSASCVAWQIGEFFDKRVVPTLYPGCDDPPPPSTCPTIVLKSADNLVNWEPEVGYNSNLAFFITDIVVGIRE
jgi:hypothetical protein